MLDDNFPFLPPWAKQVLFGELVQYAQLCTRDGRKMGNAVIMHITDTTELLGPDTVYTIVTDVGTVFDLQASEITERFYPPEYMMTEEAANAKFCI